MHRGFLFHQEMARTAVKDEEAVEAHRRTNRNLDKKTWETHHSTMKQLTTMEWR